MLRNIKNLFLKNKKGDELIETLISFPIFIALVFVLVGSMQTFMAHNTLERVLNGQMREATACAYWINDDYASGKVDENSAFGRLFLFGENKNGFFDEGYEVKEFKLYQQVLSGEEAGTFITTSWSNFTEGKDRTKTLTEINKYLTFKDNEGNYTRWRVGNKIEITVGKAINSSVDTKLVESFSTIRFPGAKQSFSLLDLTPEVTVTMTIENDSNGIQG